VTVRSVPLAYTPHALRHEQEGRVTVQLLIGRDGVPRDCRILMSSGHAPLDRNTCETLSLARFAPPLNAQGENVETSTPATVH
jgi:TonB family protein